MKTRLTFEQSNNLILRGVVASKASRLLGVPRFTLTELLALVPARKSFANAEAYLNIYFELAGHKWVAQYLDFDKDDDVIVDYSADELIDALYLLCVWCLDRGYITLENG